MNNFNFSNNVFNNNTKASISSNNLKSYSNDGGRRSIEEVRSAQLEADRLLNPNAGMDYQTKLPTNNVLKTNNDVISKPNNQQQFNSTKSEETRNRLQDMSNLNRKIF